MDTQAHKVAVLMNGSTAPSETFTATPINTGGGEQKAKRWRSVNLSVFCPPMRPEILCSFYVLFLGCLLGQLEQIGQARARGLFVLPVAVSRLQLQAVATVARADSRKRVFV